MGRRDACLSRERHHRLHPEQSDQEKRCSTGQNGKRLQQCPKGCAAVGVAKLGRGGASRARLVGLGRLRLQVLHQREKPEACGLNSCYEPLLDRSRPEVLRIQVGHDLMDRLPTVGVIAPRLPYPARHLHLLLVPQGEACSPRGSTTLTVENVPERLHLGVAVEGDSGRGCAERGVLLLHRGDRPDLLVRPHGCPAKATRRQLRSFSNNLCSIFGVLLRGTSRSAPRRKKRDETRSCNLLLRSVVTFENSISPNLGGREN
eukprot:scaffold56601_cov81-Phaeocystis_antarctica.AAC.2